MHKPFLHLWNILTVFIPLRYFIPSFLLIYCWSEFFSSKTSSRPILYSLLLTVIVFLWQMEGNRVLAGSFEIKVMIDDIPPGREKLYGSEILLDNYLNRILRNTGINIFSQQSTLLLLLSSSSVWGLALGGNWPSQPQSLWNFPLVFSGCLGVFGEGEKMFCAVILCSLLPIAPIYEPSPWFFIWNPKKRKSNRLFRQGLLKPPIQRAAWREPPQLRTAYRPL